MKRNRWIAKCAESYSSVHEFLGVKKKKDIPRSNKHREQLQPVPRRFRTFPNFDVFRLLPAAQKSDSRRDYYIFQDFRNVSLFLFLTSKVWEICFFPCSYSLNLLYLLLDNDSYWRYMQQLFRHTHARAHACTQALALIKLKIWIKTRF